MTKARFKAVGVPGCGASGCRVCYTRLWGCPVSCTPRQGHVCDGGPAAQARSRLLPGLRVAAAPDPQPLYTRVIRSRSAGTRVPGPIPIPMPGGTHRGRVSPLRPGLQTGPEWRRRGPAAPRSSCGPDRRRAGLARPWRGPGPRPGPRAPGPARPAGAPRGGTAPHDCGRGSRAEPLAEGALS